MTDGKHVYGSEQMPPSRGSVWADGKRLGDVVSITANVTIPPPPALRVTVPRKPRWAFWRKPRTAILHKQDIGAGGSAWRDVDYTRSGTFKLKSVDALWWRHTMRALGMKVPPLAPWYLQPVAWALTAWACWHATRRAIKR